MFDKIKAPVHCTTQELEGFHQLLLKGGKVESYGLRNRIRRAMLLAFHYENETLAGIATVKLPSEDYKKDVFTKASTNEDPERYSLELGYAVTLEMHTGRHICSHLVKKLIDTYQFQNIFATTETTNAYMQRILNRNGFQKTGEPYEGKMDSTKKDKRLLHLFVRMVNPNNF